MVHGAAARAIIYHITISASSVFSSVAPPQLIVQLTIIEVCSIKMGQLSLLFVQSELEVGGLSFCFFFFVGLFFSLVNESATFTAIISIVEQLLSCLINNSLR